MSTASTASTLDVQTVFAKLLATENINVEQRPAKTASFNVQTRTLVIPTLKHDISSDVYDLFVGHEVAHALYTPLEGLKQVFDQNIPKGIANCVEDARLKITL